MYYIVSIPLVPQSEIRIVDRRAPRRQLTAEKPSSRRGRKFVILVPNSIECVFPYSVGLVQVIVMSSLFITSSRTRHARRKDLVIHLRL